MKIITTSIITIGDELLIGQVVDTNSAWMAQKLNRVGITVSRRVAVGDERNAILQAFDQELALSDIVLVTGGLGPTADDITKPLLCEYFGGKMMIDPNVLAHVRYLFEKVYHRPMIERNASQAEVPDNCTVLHNANGSAPGMWFEKNGRVLVSMPGVPFEMKGIMTDELIPRLLQKYELPVILHRTMLTAGIGESFLAERIKDFESKLPPELKLAYLPHYGMVRLRLSATGFDVSAISKTIDDSFNELQQQLGDVIVSNRDEPMEQTIATLLLESRASLGTAESCTGGYIAHLLTSMPGSSRYFKGSVISYANEVKTDLLQVTEETLRLHGAVSEETVTQMAQAARQSLKTDWVIATSGIMGPDGGSEEKPVGMVWIAVDSRQGTQTVRLKFRFDRKRNIELTAFNALNFLRKCILGQSSPPKTNSH